MNPVNPDGRASAADAAASSGVRRPSPAGLEDRVASVDALRGLVILVMIFVNDVAGVSAAPRWLKHVDV